MCDYVYIKTKSNSMLTE